MGIRELGLESRITYNFLVESNGLMDLLQPLLDQFLL